MVDAPDSGDRRLAGRRVFITGAACGTGKATARRFAGSALAVDGGRCYH